MQFLARFLSLSFLLLFFFNVAFAQESTKKVNAFDDLLAKNEEKKNNIQKEIKIIQTKVEKQVNLIDQKQEYLHDKLKLLKKTSLVLDQQKNMIIQNKNVFEDIVKLDQQRKKIQEEKIKDTASFLTLEEIRSELDTENKKKEPLRESIQKSRETLEQAESSFEAIDSKWRVLNEQIESETNQDTSEVFSLLKKRELFLLQRKLTEELLFLREQELKNYLYLEEYHIAHIRLLKFKIDQLEKVVVFTNENFNAKLSYLTSQKQIATQEKQKAETLYKKYEQQYQQIQKQILNQQNPSILLLEQQATRRLQTELYQIEISIFDQILLRLEEQERIWEIRFKIQNEKVTLEEKQAWQENSIKRIKELDNEENLELVSFQVARNALLPRRIENSQTSPKITKEIEIQVETIQQKILFQEKNLASIQATRLLYTRLSEELEIISDYLSVKEQIEYGLLKLNQLLDYVIWKIDDKNTLTIKKILFAILYFIIGILIIRFLSRLLVKVSLHLFPTNKGSKAALYSLSYYFFFTILFLIVLDMINIPMTAFTFLGGAFAIGVGFGSQNLLNNFISGIILLIERPVRVDDMIELDGVTGKIKYIGMRCTQVLTSKGIDILVPNSKLLENKVVNLTLGDKTILAEVSIGVAYGSDIRQVNQTIKKVIHNHGQVLKNPSAIITLTNFGDSALEFIVRFWVKLETQMSLLIIESDVRQMIYHAFRDAGIIMPNPQQDVYLHTPLPLEFSKLEAKVENNNKN